MQYVFKLYGEEGIKNNYNQVLEPEYQKIREIIRKSGLFPGEGIVYEFTLDNEGYLKNDKGSINFKLDAAKLLSEASAAYPEFAETFPETDAVFTAEIDFAEEFTNINSAEPVVFPILTGDNSADFYRTLMAPYQPVPVTSVEVYYNDEQVVFPDVQPSLIDDRTMAQPSPLFEALGINAEYAETDGTQTITATLGEDKVVLTAGSKLLMLTAKRLSWLPRLLLKTDLFWSR